MNATQTFDPAAPGALLPGRRVHAAIADDKAMLRAAAELTRDIATARPELYWPDMLGSAAIGYAALAGAILWHDTWGALACGIVALRRGRVALLALAMLGCAEAPPRAEPAVAVEPLRIGATPVESLATLSAPREWLAPDRHTPILSPDGAHVLLATREPILALVFFGVAFIVTLVVLAMFALGFKPDDEERRDLAEQNGERPQLPGQDADTSGPDDGRAPRNPHD